MPRLLCTFNEVCECVVLSNYAVPEHHRMWVGSEAYSTLQLHPTAAVYV